MSNEKIDFAISGVFNFLIGKCFVKIGEKARLFSIGKGAVYWPLRYPKKVPVFLM